MATDTNKPPADPQKPASDAEKKHLSLLDQAMALFKNPDIQAGITDLTGLITGKSPSEAQTILDDLKKKDDERLKKIADLQTQIKANEAKLASNNELLQKSRDAVGKLESQRKTLDDQVAALDVKIASVKKTLADDDAAIEAAKKKAAGDDDEIAKLKKDAGF